MLETKVRNHVYHVTLEHGCKQLAEAREVKSGLLNAEEVKLELLLGSQGHVHSATVQHGITSWTCGENMG